MAWLLVVVVIIVIGLAVMAGSGKFGQVPPIVDDRPAPDLPEGDLSACAQSASQWCHGATQ